MKFIGICLTVLMLAVLVHCKKPIQDTEMYSYYGYWYHFSADNQTVEKLYIDTGEDSKLILCFNNNEALLACCRQPVCFDCQTKIKGQVYINKRLLKFNRDKKFNIDVAPYMENGFWKMVLNGKLFLRDLAETCTDGRLNNEETKVDCGGCNCNPCK